MCMSPPLGTYLQAAANIPTPFLLKKLPSRYIYIFMYYMYIVCKKFNVRSEMRNRGKGQSANEETKEEAEIQKIFLEIMDGYNDSVIPPLSYFSPNIEISTISRKRQRVSEYLCKERERREQMNHNFSVLRSLVPSLFNEFKPLKEKIIGETVDFIRYLQEETERLKGLLKFKKDEQNEEKSKCTNQKVTISSGATFIAIQLPSRRGLWLDIIKVLTRHQAEVLEARLSVNEQGLLTFTATVRLGSVGGSTIDKLREELSTL